MKIRDDIQLKNGVFYVTIGLADVTEALASKEKEAIAQYGEWTVNVGGSFTDFELPDQDRQFPSQFPIIQSFAIADFPEPDFPATEANDRAVTFRTVIKNRLVAARDAATALVPTDLGSNTTTV